MDTIAFACTTPFVHLTTLRVSTRREEDVTLVYNILSVPYEGQPLFPALQWLQWTCLSITFTWTLKILHVRHTRKKLFAIFIFFDLLFLPLKLQAAASNSLSPLYLFLCFSLYITLSLSLSLTNIHFLSGCLASVRAFALSR